MRNRASEDGLKCRRQLNINMTTHITTLDVLNRLQNKKAVNEMRMNDVRTNSE
jgi:hypothetical protein